MIVTRGLGRGAFLGVIVAAGLGLSVTDPGNVPGQTLPVQASLISGAPWASSELAGQTLAAQVALLTGSASGGGGTDGTASGVLVTTSSVFIEGTVTADSAITGLVYTTTISFLPGTAESFVFIPATHPDVVYDRESTASVLWASPQTNVVNRAPMVALYDQVPQTVVYYRERVTTLDTVDETYVVDLNAFTVVWNRYPQTDVYDVVQMTALISQEDQ